MRAEPQMMKTLIDFARGDDRIRLVTLEGSRTNRNIPADRYQDFDIACFVTDMDSFKASDAWLAVFGDRAMMQKPEDMELFPPETEDRFSYLILFEDGNKLDLTLIPLTGLEEYLASSDGLMKVLLDKDGLIRDAPIPDDRRYWIQRPSPREFDDCCNEFWMTSTYVVKGLARREILFAADHLHGIVRANLLRMMSWRIGAEQGYSFSVGKNYKFIDRHLAADDWAALIATYAENGYSEMWCSLFTCYRLFRNHSTAVAESLSYPYPDYDAAITRYTDGVYKSLPPEV